MRICGCKRGLGYNKERVAYVYEISIMYAMELKAYLNLLANDLQVTPRAVAQVYEDDHADCTAKLAPWRRLLCESSRGKDAWPTGHWS